VQVNGAVAGVQFCRASRQAAWRCTPGALSDHPGDTS
jgi:hypothetical protein